MAMNFMDLKAKLTLDSADYEKGLNEAEGKGKGLGKGLKTAMVAGAAAVGAAASAIGVLVKKSVDGYSEYQQMTGGVKKLYGNMGLSLEEYAASTGKSVSAVEKEWKKLEQSQNLVLNNAKQAYMTTGMSANEYMSTATSFSAALINSLGGDTVKAAKQTDVAMRAISDNFNTFGGDIGMIQGAFQGFAKQNYTMLDNLKLGYGGTKSEMERLIEDANEYAKANGMAADLSMDSFSDIVTAIDLIQQKQNIAGTTAREAGSTIEGSMMSVKAAWDNLVTGFADPEADVASLANNVITAAGTAAANTIPAITQAIKGVSQAFTVVLPQALSQIPNLIQDVAVPMLQVGGEMVLAIGQGIFNAVPQILTIVTDIIGQITESIDGALPALISKGLDGLLQFSDTVRNGAGVLIDAGLNLIVNLAQGVANALPTLIQKGPQIVTNFAGVINDNAPKILAAGIKIIVTLAQGIVQAIPTLVANLPQIVEAIWNAFTAFNWVALGGQVLNGIKAGITAMGKSLPGAMRNLARRALNAFKGISWGSVGRSVMGLIVSGLRGLASLPGAALRKAGSLAMKAFTSIAWGSVGRNVVLGIVRGVTAGAGMLFNSLKSLASSALRAAKNALGIESPSKVFRRQVGMNIALGMARGIEDGERSVLGAMDALNAGLESPVITPTVAPMAVAPEEAMYAQGTMASSGGRTVYMTNYITVDGAESPESFADRFVRGVEMKLRTV